MNVMLRYVGSVGFISTVTKSGIKKERKAILREIAEKTMSEEYTIYWSKSKVFLV